MTSQYILYTKFDHNVTTIESTIEQRNTERTIDMPAIPEMEAILSKTDIQIDNVLNL